MIYTIGFIIFVLICCILIGSIIFYKNSDDLTDELFSICFMLSLVIDFVFLIFFAIHINSSLKAFQKSKIINRELKTNYSADEIYFAEDVIDEIQQIKRKRIEVNGDLLKK